jgi:zinc/manganese transport system ATP-binding protein
LTAPLVGLQSVSLDIGGRSLFRDLTLDVEAGEFIVVLGPNGAGKTSLLRVILGLLQPSGGAVELLGSTPERGRRRVAYIPQQRSLPQDVPLRGLDVVRMGIDGTRWGLPLRRGSARQRSWQALESVDATAFAWQRIGTLSGGERQRVRVAQALVGDPRLIICDEPLLSLDMASQGSVVRALDRHRRERGVGIVFVTHDVNPVLPFLDRVLYLAGGHAVVGSSSEVLRSEVLSELYGTPVEVLRAGGGLVIAGAPEPLHEHVAADELSPGW